MKSKTAGDPARKAQSLVYVNYLDDLSVTHVEQVPAERDLTPHPLELRQLQVWHFQECRETARKVSLINGHAQLELWPLDGYGAPPV